MSKRLKYTFILILIMAVILSVYLFAFYLPNINADSVDYSQTDYESKSSNIDKHVVFIGKNLSEAAEYQSVMLLKSMFNAYSNISFSIYDSQGEIEKQKDYLTDILDEKADVVVLNPLDFETTLPLVTELNNCSISVIIIGNHKISPYYISVGYSPVYTGQLLAKNASNKITQGNISVIMKTNNYNLSSEVIKGLSAELSKTNSISIDSINYLSEFSDSNIIKLLKSLSLSDAIILLDSYSFDKTYDILISQGYSGTIFVVSQSKNHFAKVMDNPNLTLVYQDPEELNKQLFDTLLNVFNNTTKNPHLEVSQYIIDRSNIEEYIIE